MNQHNFRKSYILEVYQALTFTDGMKHSLINPNQIWFNNISLNDNPWENEDLFVIKCGCEGEDLFIPFRVKGDCHIF